MGMSFKVAPGVRVRAFLYLGRASVMTCESRNSDAASCVGHNA